MTIFEELRRSGDCAPVSDERMHEVRALLLDEASPTMPRRGPGRVLTTVAALAVAGGGTAFAAHLLWGRSDPRTTTTIECGIDTYIPAPTGDPVADCHAALARSGADDPDLKGWVTPSGVVAVLPASVQPPAGSTPLAQGFTIDSGVRYVTDSLGDIGGPLQQRCLSGEDATTYARSQLELAGLGSWQVTVDAPPSTSSSCPAYVGVVDATSTSVELVPSPGGRSATDDPSVRLASLLHQQLAARCQSAADGVATAEAAAKTVGLRPAEYAVSDAGTIAPPRSGCATAFVELGGLLGVQVWQAPPS